MTVDSRACIEWKAQVAAASQRLSRIASQNLIAGKTGTAHDPHRCHSSSRDQHAAGAPV